MQDPLTPEGGIVLKALEVHRLHLESHGCGQCLNTYETLLKAVTAWVGSQSQKEELHGEQEEAPKNDGKGQGKSTRAEHVSASTQNQKPSKEKDPLAIFR